MSSSNFATITVLFALFLTGCASNPERSSVTQTATSSSSEMATTKEKSPDDVVCTYEKIVGKLIKKKYCYTRKKRDALREESQKASKTMKSGRLSNSTD